jgi:hypothetical protein
MGIKCPYITCKHNTKKVCECPTDLEFVCFSGDIKHLESNPDVKLLYDDDEVTQNDFYTEGYIQGLQCLQYVFDKDWEPEDDQ